MLKVNPTGIKLFALGMLGVLSLLTVTLPVPPQIVAQFSPLQIKLMTLVNPIILLLIATTIGVFANKSINLKLANFDGFLRYDNKTLLDLAKTAVLGGIIAGGLITALTHFTETLVDTSKLQNLEMTLAARLLYGGITEEILMRFGLMTSVAALLYKFAKFGMSNALLGGLIASTVLFALGHIPVVLAADPNPSLGLITHILLGNSIAGVFFGYLYWKRGLDYSMVAHMFTHLTMVVLASL